tara:strand:- start:521 stop:673 length:153 start_codon:yes stop_codon:yes gene_type:complete
MESTLEGEKLRSAVKFATRYAIHLTDQRLEESPNSYEKQSVNLKRAEEYK